MDIAPFNIYYVYDDILYNAQVRPCCGENNVVDYAVWEDDELTFTLTRRSGTGKWVVSLKNADDDIADEKVQAIGGVIEQRLADQ